MKYLGHVVGSGELCVDPDKVSAVADWAACSDSLCVHSSHEQEQGNCSENHGHSGFMASR